MLRDVRAINTGKKARAHEKKQLKLFRNGQVHISLGHVYAIICEMFDITTPDPPNTFLKRINEYYGGSNPYFPNLFTTFHSGLTPTLENFLYREYRKMKGFSHEKIRFIIGEAMGIPFGDEPQELREKFIDYSTRETTPKKYAQTQKPD